MLNRLLQFLNKNNILYKYQFGFRKKSCNFKCPNRNDRQYTGCPNKKATCLTYYNLPIKAPKLLTNDSF